MPIHESWLSLLSALKKQYGDRGEEVFYRYMNKHGYDETKPREGQKSKLKGKEFSLEGEITPIVDKQFYGASMQIIDYVEIKDASGTNFYVEGFLSAPVKDLHGETVSENVLFDWSKECVAPPHNLGWLFHESPYKSPENKDKPAIYRIVESKISELKDRLGNTHRGLWVKALLNKAHPKFNDVWNMVKTGFINSFSVEFLPELEDASSKLLQKAKYLASCFVMAPAMDLATITSAYAKSFNGGKIEMSEKATNIPDVPADDLETLLRARDQNIARLIGEPVPGVNPPQPNLPLTVPQPAPPANAPVPPVPQPSTPVQNIDPNAQKIDQILQRMGTLEQRLNIVAPIPKDPEPEEIMRVIKYLSGKEDLFKPKPNPQTKEAVLDELVDKAVWSPDEDWPDSCFLYVPEEAKGSDGKKSLRKLPYKSPDGKVDLAHVRNALARLPQTEGIPEDVKARIKRKLQAMLGRESSDYEPKSKGYSWEEVEELLDAEFEEGKKNSKLVVKAVLDNAPQPTGTSTDLSQDNVIDQDSIEGQLTVRDRMFRTQPIGYP